MGKEYKAKIITKRGRRKIKIKIEKTERKEEIITITITIPMRKEARIAKRTRKKKIGRIKIKTKKKKNIQIYLICNQKKLNTIRKYNIVNMKKECKKNIIIKTRMIEIKITKHDVFTSKTHYK